MLTFSQMPDLLVLEIAAEDAVGAVPGSFGCPIAHHIKKHVGKHDGISRATNVINGARYLPEPDAVAFMDLFDGRRPVDYPVTVSFRRRPVHRSPEGGST